VAVAAVEEAAALVAAADVGVAEAHAREAAMAVVVSAEQGTLPRCRVLK
jgi:hypothetical protein